MALAETQYGKFFYFAPDAIGQMIASGVFWDAHFRPWLDGLGPDDVFVDVGANIGFFTIYVARRGAKVYSFEASPEVFDLLDRNVALNGLRERVLLENGALYDKAGELTLNPEWNDWPKLENGRVDYEHHSNSGGMSLVPGNGGPYRIKAETLDSYRLSKCSLIKSDVQGADLRVLVGAEKTIEEFRPVVLFEMEPIPARLHGDSIEKAMQFFEGKDYTVICVNSGGYGQKDFVAVPRG